MGFFSEIDGEFYYMEEFVGRKVLSHLSFRKPYLIEHIKSSGRCLSTLLILLQLQQL